MLLWDLFLRLLLSLFLRLEFLDNLESDAALTLRLLGESEWNERFLLLLLLDFPDLALLVLLGLFSFRLLFFCLRFSSGGLAIVLAELGVGFRRLAPLIGASCCS